MEEIQKIQEETIQMDERGASMLEYALLAALIAVVAIGAITFLGTEVSQSFSTVGSSLDTTN